MAYDEKLAARIRERISNLPNIEEKEMMGGLVFMYNGKMCLGIIKDELMCRIDPALHDIEVEKNGCRTMDFTKRPMKGYIMIEEVGRKSKKDFDYWIDLALDFNSKAKASKKKQKKVIIRK
jgi:TfoX/Sxy family transcriptional regulator of competence genes